MGLISMFLPTQEKGVIRLMCNTEDAEILRDRGCFRTKVSADKIQEDLQAQSPPDSPPETPEEGTDEPAGRTGDRGSGRPGTIGWHCSCVDEKETIGAILQYVKEVTGKSITIKPKSVLSRVKATAKTAIKKHIEARAND